MPSQTTTLLIMRRCVTNEQVMAQAPLTQKRFNEEQENQ